MGKMMNGKLLQAISVFMFLTGIAVPLQAQGGKVVVVKAAIASSEESKGLATITVELNVKDGWHTYAQLPDDSPSMATAAKLTLPEGVEAIGEWNVPAGEDYAKEPGTTVFEGKIKLTRDVKITASSKRRTIGVQVNYQACNDKSCLPPKRLKIALSVPASTEAADKKPAATKKRISPASATPEGENASGHAGKMESAAMNSAKANNPKSLPKFENKFFDAPVRLTVGSEPLNLKASQMYPSPAMFDVDNDGEVELVVGDIFGSLNVYENENETGAGDPVWAKHVALTNTEGKAIKVSNW